MRGFQKNLLLKLIGIALTDSLVVVRLTVTTPSYGWLVCVFVKYTGHQDECCLITEPYLTTKTRLTCFTVMPNSLEEVCSWWVNNMSFCEFVCSPAHVFAWGGVRVLMRSICGQIMSSSFCFGVFIFHKMLQWNLTDL